MKIALPLIALLMTMPGGDPDIGAPGRSSDARISADMTTRFTLDSATFEKRNDRWFRMSHGLSFPLVPGRLTVRADSSTVAEIVEFVADAGGRVIGHARRNRLGFVDLRIDGVDQIALARHMQASGRFDAVEIPCQGRWQAEPGDPYFSLQWHLRNTGQAGWTPDADIGMQHAWQNETGDPEVMIAFLDSPIRVIVDELVDAFPVNPGEFPGNGVDDDDNGYPDDLHGWNFHLQSGEIIGDFLNAAHGTSLSALAVARNRNNIGIGSVAGGDATRPGCSAIACVIGQEGPESDLVDDAIIYAVDRGARVLSLAFAIAPDPSIEAAIEYAAAAGVFMPAPAGNLTAPDLEVLFPASHELVMAVGATNGHDGPWAFTIAGPEVEIAAPGIGLVTIGLSPILDYEVVGGTSYSMAQVAGAAAMILSWADCLDGDDVRRILRESAVDVHTSGWDAATGFGRLDVGRALEQVIDESIPGCRCAEDLDGDGAVTGRDLGRLLAGWGGSDAVLDLNRSGEVGVDDLALWLDWNGTCR